MIDAIEVTEEIKTEVATLEDWTKSIVVSNPMQRTAVYEAVKSVKEKKAKIVEFFKASKEAAHTAWKAIVANEKSFTDKLDAFESAGKRAILSFDKAEEEKRIAEQRRLQAEADARARAERERLEKEAARLKTAEKKEERLAAAAAVIAPVIELAPVIEKIKGESTRKIWRARVIDSSAIPREYMIVNEKALDSIAKATKGAIKISGVEFYAEESLAIR